MLIPSVGGWTPEMRGVSSASGRPARRAPDAGKGRRGGTLVHRHRLYRRGDIDSADEPVLDVDGEAVERVEAGITMLTGPGSWPPGASRSRTRATSTNRRWRARWPPGRTGPAGASEPVGPDHGHATRERTTSSCRAFGRCDRLFRAARVGLGALGITRRSRALRTRVHAAPRRRASPARRGARRAPGAGGRARALRVLRLPVRGHCAHPTTERTDANPSSGAGMACTSSSSRTPRSAPACRPAARSTRWCPRPTAPRPPAKPEGAHRPEPPHLREPRLVRFTEMEYAVPARARRRGVRARARP